MVAAMAARKPKTRSRRATEVIRLGREQLGRVIQSYLPRTEGAMIDIGCGKGWWAETFARNSGDLVVAVDLPSTLRLYNLPPAGSKAIYVAADAASLPLPDNMFFFALMLNTLHHINPRDHARALLEAHRILQPGGILCVVEALCTGPAFEITQPFKDETKCCATAQHSLDALSLPVWRVLPATEFQTVIPVSDLNELKATYWANPEYTSKFDANYAEIGKRFANNAINTGPGYEIENHMLARGFAKPGCDDDTPW